MKNRYSKGFTLVEVMASMVILVLALSMAMSGYIFLLKNSNQGDIQHELDLDVQRAIETLKVDLRLSSMDEIFGYPENSPPFEAISFPTAKINPNTGRLTRDPVTKEIIWDTTVIYHIVSGAPDKLTKTVFSPRDNSLNDEERQAQLNNVVQNDGPQGAENSANASSQVIFENLLNWGLAPNTGRFSAYASTPGQETISMGYSLLNADTNTFTFTVIGRNPKNTSGYKIGLDQILGSPSYQYQEAENQTVSHNGGATPVANKNISYGNRHELLFKGSQVNDSFTVVLNNDNWEVTDFNDDSTFSYNEKTVIATEYQLANGNGDIVVKLDGSNVVWEAESQTADFSDLHSTNIIAGTQVAILLKGSSLSENAGHIRGIGQRSSLTFQATDPIKISDVYFGESTSSNSIVMAYGTQKQVTFPGNPPVLTIANNASVTSDWIDIPIEQTKNYIVTYTLQSTGSAKVWRDSTSYYNGDAPSTIVGTNWVYYIPALKSVSASYVDKGTYTSDILDTRLDDPSYNDLSWDSIYPGGTRLGFKVRSGNNPDLSDASDFDSITANYTSLSKSSFSLPHSGRYIQFQALMESDSTYLKTPLLRDVTIDWVGERRMVNVMGKFSKGPDFADFELSVNGKPLQSALIVNLEIYKDTQSMGKEMQRMSSSIKAEITPRNSGL